jgi:acyl-CoA thioesterase-1
MSVSRTLLTVIAITVFTLAGCQKDQEPAAALPAAPPASDGTIVAVGDSLTAGLGLPESDAYPAQLERKLHQAGYRWRVVNAGISGETSSGTLSRINWIMKLKPDIVILVIGGNDGLRGVDPRLTAKNIDKIVTELQAKGVVVVLGGMQMLRNLGPGYVADFAAVYPKIARKHDLILVPFFLTNVAGNAALNQADGIHPTAKGYRVVTETIFPFVVQAIEKKRVNKLR